MGPSGPLMTKAWMRIKRSNIYGTDSKKNSKASILRGSTFDEAIEMIDELTNIINNDRGENP